MSTVPKVVLVTGGARGIGAAVSVAAAQRGYSVAVCYQRAADRAQQVADLVRACGCQAVTLRCDVRDTEQVTAVFDQAQRALGPVTALVNSAGITGPSSALADADPQHIREVLDTNVLGTLLPCREAARRMSTRRGGHGGVIVNLSSGAASLGSPDEFVWYAASKGAIDSLTIGLSKELAADSIRVNAVSPGLTETELHALSTLEPGRIARLAPSIPMRRAATPAEIAAPVMWLLSDEASYVSGAILRAAGGR